MPPHIPMIDGACADDIMNAAIDVKQSKTEKDQRNVVAHEEPHRKVSKVSFNQKVLCYKHLHLNDYTDEEAEATWYSETEYCLIKKECITTVKMMINDNVQFLDNDRYCSRGLESRTPRGAHIRSENKYHALEVVLSEQDLQWKQGVSDPQHLAELCSECGRLSLSIAHLMALEDENFVHEFFPSSLVNHQHQHGDERVAGIGCLPAMKRREKCPGCCKVGSDCQRMDDVQI